MAIIIKKVTRGTLITLVSLGGLALALFTRLIFGDFHVNLGNLDSDPNNVFDKSGLIKSVQADTPAGNGGDSCEGGGSSGSGGER